VSLKEKLADGFECRPATVPQFLCAAVPVTAAVRVGKVRSVHAWTTWGSGSIAALVF
jgi:hypothetical protein